MNTTIIRSLAATAAAGLMLTSFSSTAYAARTPKPSATSDSTSSRSSSPDSTYDYSSSPEPTESATPEYGTLYVLCDTADGATAPASWTILVKESDSSNNEDRFLLDTTDGVSPTEAKRQFSASDCDKFDAQLPTPSPTPSPEPTADSEAAVRAAAEPPAPSATADTADPSADTATPGIEAASPDASISPDASASPDGSAAAGAAALSPGASVPATVDGQPGHAIPAPTTEEFPVPAPVPGVNYVRLSGSVTERCGSNNDALRISGQVFWQTSGWYDNWRLIYVWTMNPNDRLAINGESSVVLYQADEGTTCGTSSDDREVNYVPRKPVSYQVDNRVMIDGKVKMLEKCGPLNDQVRPAQKGFSIQHTEWTDNTMVLWLNAEPGYMFDNGQLIKPITVTDHDTPCNATSQFTEGLAATGADDWMLPALGAAAVLVLTGAALLLNQRRRSA